MARSFSLSRRAFSSRLDAVCPKCFGPFPFPLPFPYKSAGWSRLVAVCPKCSGHRPSPSNSTGWRRPAPPSTRVPSRHPKYTPLRHGAARPTPPPHADSVQSPPPQGTHPRPTPPPHADPVQSPPPQGTHPRPTPPPPHADSVQSPPPQGTHPRPTPPPPHVDPVQSPPPQGTHPRPTPPPPHTDPVQSPPPQGTHLRPTPPPPHTDPVQSPPPQETDEISGLRERLNELYHQLDALTPVEEQLEESVELLRDEISRNHLALAIWERQNHLALEIWERQSTLQYGVIPFVAAIEQANRYFDFKKAAKTKYQEQFNTTKNLQQLDIAEVLHGDQELKSKFDKIGDTEIRQAARAIYYELEDEERAKKYKHIKKREDLALDLPIYNLVFRAREQDIVMDQNPVVELEKIMKSSPSLYDACFRLEVPPEEYLTTTMEAKESYYEFWSKYAKASCGVEPSVVKVEDDNYVFPSTGTDGFGEDLMQKLGALDQQLKKKLLEKEAWDAKCQNVFDEFCGTQIALRESERRSALPYAVIPFVAEIEKANRYFEYKKAVKEKYRLQFSTNPYLMPLDIAAILRADDNMNSKFNKPGDLDIGTASLAVYFELGDEIRLKSNVPWRPDLPELKSRKRRDVALDRPIYNLVFQARRQCVVMDEDPTVELEKIMESNLSLYDACFDMSGKPVDGLATAAAEARIKYSQIWSTYFEAAKGKKGKTSAKGKKTTQGKKGGK